MFKIATRQRPKQFERLVRNIIENCSLQNYFILVSADVDDSTMYNQMVHEFCAHRGIIIVFGESKSKIDAINRDIEVYGEPKWDILVNVSDDMEFIYKGFDIGIRNEFHDGLDWFVHFPDNNRTDICTLSILGKDYYNRTHEIYYNKYKSVCSDMDATEQAKSLGRYRYNPKVIVKHNHPAYKSGDWDELYVRNEQQKFYSHDEEILKQRRFSNFNN